MFLETRGLGYIMVRVRSLLRVSFEYHWPSDIVRSQKGKEAIKSPESSRQDDHADDTLLIRNGRQSALW